MCVKYNKIDSTSQLNNIFFVTQQMIQEKSLNVLVGGSLDSQALLVPLPSTLTCIMARFRIQIVAKKIMPARYCTTLIFNFSSIRQQTVTILEDWLVPWWAAKQISLQYPFRHLQLRVSQRIRALHLIRQLNGNKLGVLIPIWLRLTGRWSYE